jgi:cytochrome c-type biogenesis protein CcmH
MLFWFIAIAVTAIACAALYYAAAGRMVNDTVLDSTPANSHFRLVLAGIDADLANGKLGEAEAVAAKGELAREMLRHQADENIKSKPKPEVGRLTVAALLGAVAVLSLVTYWALGSPNMPSQPLAGRTQSVAQDIDLPAAIARIEQQLATTPDDLRGWSVIAPVYLQTRRYPDAEHAYRRIIELGGGNADIQTALAETLMLQANGSATGEAMSLLQSAAASDPTHVLSRLYIAAELTRTGQYDEAVKAWNAALALSKGDEGWLTAATEGRSVALNKGAVPEGQTATPTSEAIASMVSGLATRLAAQGGTIEEWTQLVRAYVVLKDLTKAQAAYDDALKAYPKTFDRGDLDAVALEAGLKGATP